MNSSVLLVDIRDEVALVTLNRPQAMNALSRELRAAIAETFDALNRNNGVRAAILTGAGKAFCAGLDLKELGKGTDSVADSVETADPVTSIGRFHKPLIGAINGVAITGGFELALACDLMICSPDARFADTHGRVGILPGWGLSQKLSRTIGVYRAKELSLTGNFLSAAQAYEWGMINRIVPSEELIPVCQKLAADMLTLVPECLPAYKRLIDEGYAQDFGTSLTTEKSFSAKANKAVSADAIESRREEVRARGQLQKT